MDRMPDAELAFVEETKVVNYLLARTGRGRAKADFFEAFGFASDRWEDLAEALLDHGKEGSLARSYQTPYVVPLRGRGQVGDTLGQAPVPEDGLARGSLRKTARAASHNRCALVRRR